MRVLQHAQSVARDLFLLENQIPYQVLRVLMGMNSEFSEGMIILFIRHIISESWFQMRCHQTGIGEEDTPIHLLELF